VSFKSRVKNDKVMDGESDDERCGLIMREVTRRCMKDVDD